ncbi:MAG: FlgD immunoglobulin-like domain containing protein [Spirochaetota bacterium]
MNDSPRRRRLAALLTVLILGTSLVFAYNPAPGADDFADLTAPGFLGGGADATAVDEPLGDGYNPAVSGDKERPSAGLFYSVLAGFGGAPNSGVGHLIAADFDLPTQLGVIGGSALFLTSPFADMATGQHARIRMTYARDLFPRFWIGGAGNLYVGTADRFGLGITGDIGFLHLPESLLGLEGFRWGVVFQNMGIAYNPYETDSGGNRITGLPSIFTPAVGFSLPAVDSEDLDVRLAINTSFPRFQNVRGSLGVDVTYRDVITAKLGGRFDLHQLDQPAIEQRGFAPSFGVGVNVTNLIAAINDEDAPSRADDARAVIAASPLTGDVWAFGVGVEVPFGAEDDEGPEVSLDYGPTEYISPNNDGVQDYLTIPISIEDQSPIQGYRLEVADASGNVVRTIENKDDRPEIRFGDLIDEIREGETGIEIPDQIRWEGQSDNGVLVADGTYEFSLTAWDINGNYGSSSSYSVVVDTTQPNLLVRVPSDRIFSPNDDGNKDTLTIVQEGSEEARVSAQITNASDDVVRTFTWQDEAPAEVTWDGTNDDGESVSDGVYTYTVRSSDRAGNTASQSVSNLVINTEPRSVFVTVSADGFSPNDDGNADSVTFDLIVNSTEGLESWELSVVSEDGRVARTFSGQELREEIVWAGADEDGDRINGVYRAVLELRYENGDRPSGQSSRFVLDTEGPQLVVEPKPQPFSPDNDGVADDLFIAIDVEDLSDIASWELSIIDPRDRLFKRYAGVGRPADEIIWNGQSDDGELVQAAEDYPYEFTITDELGNTSTAEGIISVDVLVIRDEDGRLKIQISNITFAPNSPEYVTDDVDRFEKNIEIIARIAEILNKFDTYDVLIEGHAVNITGTDREQREELVPLSRSRAETVRDSLVERGVDRGRLSVEGVGGLDPIVPHTDLDERWRNRRVEFILIR